MNLALSIIANLLTNESGKEKVSEQNIKFLVSMLEEIVASELYDQLDLVTKTSIMSRTIRALGNAASSNESNLAKIHKLRNVLKYVFKTLMLKFLRRLRFFRRLRFLRHLRFF